MSVFLLETDALTSVASSVQSLASQVKNISSSVSGYDTSCEDGFNFDSAKSVIAGNLDACVTKIENTATILEKVQESHTNLQNSMKFSPPGEKDKSKDSGNSNDSKKNDNSRRSNVSNNSGGSSNSGNYGGGSPSVSVGAPSAVAAGAIPVAGAVPVATQTNLNEKKEEKEESRIGIVDAKITSVGYATVDKEMNKESKALFADKDFSYKNGYATIGDCFVIACDSSIGKVGDVIQFVQKDGTVVHAVIGVTTHEKGNADKIYFLVDQNSKDLKRSKICDTLLQNNKVIKNFGSIYDIRDVSSAAKSVSGDTKVVFDIINGKSTQNIQGTQGNLETQGSLETQGNLETQGSLENQGSLETQGGGTV